MKKRFVPLCALTSAILFVAAAGAQEKTDYSLVHLIKRGVRPLAGDGHARRLTDRYGPRLTASPEFDEAADWTANRLTGMAACGCAFRKLGAVRTEAGR